MISENRRDIPRIKITEKNTNRSAPFGYLQDLNNKYHILVDEKTAFIVREAFELIVPTGASSSEPITNNPLSETGLGVYSIEEAEEFLSYTEKSRMKDIISALGHFDTETAMETFSMKECLKTNLYPDIWNDEGETDEIKEELTNYFQKLKDFYKKY